MIGLNFVDLILNSAVAAAIDYLVDLGHRNIGFIRLFPNRDRITMAEYQGFRRI